MKPPAKQLVHEPSQTIHAGGSLHGLHTQYQDHHGPTNLNIGTGSTPRGGQTGRSKNQKKTTGMGSNAISSNYDKIGNKKSKKKNRKGVNADVGRMVSLTLGGHDTGNMDFTVARKSSGMTHPEEEELRLIDSQLGK